MAQESYLHLISPDPDFHVVRFWANGKFGFISDPGNHYVYHFFECKDSGAYKYDGEERQAHASELACGIVAWWLKHRQSESVDKLFESYYQARLNMYRVDQAKVFASWNATELEEEFLDGNHQSSEAGRIKSSEAIFEFLSESDAQLIRQMSSQYLQFVESKVHTTTQKMEKFTQNEIITLRHLSDGQQHADRPSSLTAAQFYVALKSLKEHGLVRAAFLEGGGVESCQIKIAGQATVDDMKSAERRILRRLVKATGLTQDQYELLLYARVHGKCENIFDIDWMEYKEQIYTYLYDNRYIQDGYDADNNSILVLTRKGSQLVDDIEDELTADLAEGKAESSGTQGSTLYDTPKLTTAAETFMQTVGPFRFEDLALVKVLTPAQQAKLVEKIVQNGCYGAAMLFYLGYFERLKDIYQFRSNTQIIQHCAQATGCAQSGFKKYFYSLKSDQPYDSYDKNNARKLIDSHQIEQDYNAIKGS